MTKRAKITAIVGKLLAGRCLRSVREQLGKSGRVGVDIILDALEGKHGVPPKSRHPRDVSDDLVGGLHSIAKVNPDPLLAALDDRPNHASSLIWALGGLRQVAVVKTLVEHSKHKDLWVRWAAVEGLARCRKESRLQPLLAALGDRSDMVRFSALLGLVKVADRSAIEPLKHYLRSKRMSVGGKRITIELLARLEAGE